MRAERMDRQKTGQMIGHCVRMALMMSQDGVNGMVLSMIGHGMTVDAVTGRGMMDGMNVLTVFGQIGMMQSKKLPQSVDSRTLHRVLRRLSSRVPRMPRL